MHIYMSSFVCLHNSRDVAASVQLLFSVAGHSVPHGRLHMLDVPQAAVLIRAYGQTTEAHDVVSLIKL